MGRSVYVPEDAFSVKYFFVEEDESEFFVEDLQEILLESAKAVYGKDYWIRKEKNWIGNETLCIVRDDFGLYCVSEYCGTFAVYVLANPNIPDDIWEPIQNRETWDGICIEKCTKVMDEFSKRIGLPIYYKVGSFLTVKAYPVGHSREGWY